MTARSPLPLALIANARMPSQRAQSLQLAHAATSFARAGAPTRLVVALRFPTPELPPGQDVFDYYAVPAGARPELLRVACCDWIDRVPRRLQFVPSRLQELTFSRNAARAVRPDERVLSREIECAQRLARRGHEQLFFELHRVPGGKLRRRWLLEAAAGARGVVAISGGVREDLVALGLDAGKIVVEHDAYDGSRATELSDGTRSHGEARGRRRAAARQRLGLDAERPVVVYTGGLLAWKGVELLVDAARELPEVQVVIAGGMDADVARLRERARGLENVRLDGFQAPGRIPDYLAAADCGVCPNRSQPAISARYTSPLKIFEAMAAGLPMVCSDLPSLREILRPEEQAVFVAPDDAPALAAGLRRLLGDARLSADIRSRLLARAPEHTWDARAQRLLAWMDSL